MATDEELRAAGIHLPSGSDYISNGDDAISANARVLWERIEAQRAYRGLALSGMDPKTAAEGWYYVASGSLAESLGMPKRAQGWMGIFGAQPRPRMIEFRQTDIISSTSLEVWIRTTDHTGAWTRPWHQVYPAPVTETSVVTHRHQILADDQATAVSAPVRTDGATPVALTWDDYPAATRDLVVPMLRARGIRATLAICSRTMTPERAPYLGGEGITWPEVDAWVAEGIFEIANHSAHHMGATTDAELHDAIVTGLEELQALTPSGVVRTWVQPSVTYPDFENGLTLAAWTNTRAGQLILDHHAFATGLYRRAPGVFTDPRRGRPVQGTGRTWIDAGTSSAQALIESLQGTDHGVIIGAHANRLTMGTGYTTPAQLETFLDWLVTEQDAGRVRLLTLSEWAWADARTHVSHLGDGIYEIGT